MGFEKHDWESIWTQPTQPWVESGGDQSLRLIYPELLTLRGEFSSGSTALVPLCGDSTAVRYLFDRGHRVTAVDFVPDAVRKLAQTQFADAEFAWSGWIIRIIQPKNIAAHRLHEQSSAISNLRLEPLLADS